MPLSYVVGFILLASAATAGAIRYKRLSDSGRWLFFLLLIIVTREVLGYWVGHIYRSNLIIYHLLIPIQCIVLLVVYGFELEKYRWLMGVLMGIVLIAGLTSLVMNRHELTRLYPSTLQNSIDVISVLVILLYLRELIIQPTIYPFEQYPLFWLSVGWLLLIVLSTVGLGAFNFISRNYPTSYAILTNQIRNLADWQLYIFFLVGFLSKQRSIGQAHG